MSKASTPHDRWAQVYSAAHTRDPRWCVGCGYFPVVHDGEHRADCTATQTTPATEPGEERKS
jgi:hypothetical protein